MKRLVLFIIAACAVSAIPVASGSKASSGAKVYFVSPADGATVSNPVKVVFGLSGMGVAPAGINKDNTGHHHLIINGELKDLTAPIPNDDKHKHFGGGQTETTIELPSGQHTLQLVLGDFKHVPHSPPVTSETITINVK